MWDLMYPTAYKPRSYGYGSGGRGGAAANRRCRACGARIGIARLAGGGQPLPLNYCQQHFCRFLVKDAAGVCSEQNNGRSHFCDAHIRCHATEGEGRCWRFVKEENPEKYQWCKKHGCNYPDCKVQRTDPNNPNCPLHRCHYMACDKAKQQDTGSLFCDRHTCLAHTCLALIPDTTLTAAGHPSRYCNTHRPCTAPDCTRPCYTRANGTPAIRFCGDHYCAADACNQMRVAGARSSGGGGGGGGDRCREHTCDETDCVRPKHAGEGTAGGRFCEEHSCKTMGCEDRRDRRFATAEHCPFHTCAVVDCAKAGSSGGGRCEAHRECSVDGCREWVYIEKGADGDIRHGVCEKHHQPRCSGTTILGTPCETRLPLAPHGAPATTRFCAEHACSFRACANERPPTSLQFCLQHQCAAAGCQEQVKHAALLSCLTGDNAAATRFMLLAAAASGGGAGLGLGMGMGAGAGAGLFGGSRFCAAHSCLGDGGKCGAEVAVGGDGTGRRRAGGGGGGGSSSRGKRGPAAGSEEVRRFCSAHECSHRGCRVEATHQSRRRGGMCDRHYRQRRDGIGGGGGGGGGGGLFAGGMGGVGPMGMMPPGFPPFFGGGTGGGGYESTSESSSDGDGRRPVVLPFGAPFFY